MILDHINDIAAICAAQGVKTAIISPGSRSAPLTLAFVRHPDIETRVIPDERAAAFIGMGMAQQQKRPVVLVCTSGSAAYNYAPAVAEAFFQQIPLLVLTADRPPEWIDQYDGQTIRQKGIYGQHVKASFDFPDNPNHPDIAWHGNRIVNEALIASMNEPLGPVHINVPLREPFYPEVDERTFFRKVRTITKSTAAKMPSTETWAALLKTWNQSDKKLVVAGQQTADSQLANSLSSLSRKTGAVVVSDIISNQHEVEGIISHQDAFLHPSLADKNQVLQPDLLITFGKSNISKNLKLFLRKHPATVHWHIQPHERYQDTFQSLTQLIEAEAPYFFQALESQTGSANDEYQKQWQAANEKVAHLNNHFFQDQSFGEFQAVQSILSHLPEHSQLQLANSMAVRYANFLGLKDKKGITVWCNRGTSGIDGSNSTAVGAALSQDQMVTLITGDMAFFYDRNAFWHNYPTPNLRVIVLNNQAGGIFRLIKGPSDQPELEEYFETRQQLNAKSLAAEFGFGYSQATDAASLAESLKSFYSASEQAKILEIHTDSATNAAIFKAYWSFIFS